MKDWLIIIIVVLVVINIVAFSSAIWVAYNHWKKHGKMDWSTPLLGLFFIPLCAFIAVAWPVRIVAEYLFVKRDKKKREKRNEELKEKSKKYHLIKSELRLKNLPYTPSSRDLIFIENGYNDKINHMIQRNLDFIQECCDKGKYYKHRFVYLPNLIQEVQVDKESFDYYVPFWKNYSLATDVQLSSSSLLEYMNEPENRDKFQPCFARYLGYADGCSWFECVSFNPDEDVDEKDFFRRLCSLFDKYPMCPGPMFQRLNIERVGADEKFDESTEQLMKEIEERVSELRIRGVSQWAIELLLKPKFKLSKMIVTKDYRILLPEYQNIEIKMEPLVKAVYLLFLKHPDGMMFKQLPDYREELEEIYLMLKPNGLTEKVKKSIHDVTDPTLNSINEKCARIRKAFLLQFDDHLARYYYIGGERATPKKIYLPKDLVVWEQ